MRPAVYASSQASQQRSISLNGRIMLFSVGCGPYLDLNVSAEPCSRSSNSTRNHFRSEPGRFCTGSFLAPFLICPISGKDNPLSVIPTIGMSFSYGQNPSSSNSSSTVLSLWGFWMIPKSCSIGRASINSHKDKTVEELLDELGF